MLLQKNISNLLLSFLCIVALFNAKNLRASLKAALSARIAPRRLMSTDYETRQRELRKFACCKETQVFDSRGYREKTNADYGAYIGPEFKCPCTQPWPESKVDSLHDGLLNDIIKFRTNLEGHTLLHTLPACRMKLLIKYGADINARNFETRPIGNRSNLRERDPKLFSLIDKASKANGNRHARFAPNNIHYFIGEDGSMKIAQGVSIEKYDGDFHYWYNGLTATMCAVYQHDFAKFAILLAASSPDDIQENLLDLQIIAGWVRYADLSNKQYRIAREQGQDAAGKIDLLEPSVFEIALKKYEVQVVALIEDNTKEAEIVNG